MKNVLLMLLIFGSMAASSQKFAVGDRLTPSSAKFQLLAISSKTGVSTYKYTGSIVDKYFYNRQIDDIIVGFKNGVVVTTIYNLIPEKNDVGVPQSLIDQIQKSLPYPLANRNGIWGVNIDNETISISRTSSVMTFNKDRIMYYSSVKNSILSR